MARTKATAKKNSKKAATRASLAAIGKDEKPAAKRKHRFRPGTVALREIRQYQKSVDCLIKRAPFMRLVKEALGKFGEFRLKRSAFEALQEICQSTLVNLFNDTQLAAINAKRVTIMAPDMKLVQQLLKNNGIDSFSDFSASDPGARQQRRIAAEAKQLPSSSAVTPTDNATVQE